MLYDPHMTMPGKERNQEPVKIAPIPDYEYPYEPARWPTSGTPPKERVHIPEMQPVRDPEHEDVPVSHSPTRTKTKPFLPARRHEDPGPEHAQVSLVHSVQTESLPNSSRPASETQKPKPENTKTPPANVSPNLPPNLPNRAQNNNLANKLAGPKTTQKPRAYITTPLPERFKFVGRGVGRERTFFEVIELLTLTQREGDFPNGITDRMRKYYRQTYPEYFSASKRSAEKRASNKHKADRLRAQNRPRRRKVKPVIHSA